MGGSDRIGVARRPSVAVIGGGIAGLAAALRLSDEFTVKGTPQGVGISVWDSSPELGGKLRTGSVAGIEIDVGAESMLASRPEAVELAGHVGLGSLLEAPAVSAPGLVLPGGVVRALPPGLVMGIPGDLAGLATADVLSAPSLEMVAAEADLPVAPVMSDVSIGRYVRERLGREVVERLVEPLLGGVYAGHADELSLHACVPTIFASVADGEPLTVAAAHLLERARAASLESEFGSADGTKSPRGTESSAGGSRFVGVQGGVATLIRAVADRLASQGVVMHMGSTVRGLSRTAHGWRLTVGSAAAPEYVDVDAVVLATPALPTSRLLADVDPLVAREVGDIEYASVAVVTFAFRGRDVEGVGRSSGVLVVPQPDRLVKASTFSSSKWSWLGRQCATRDEPLVLVRASVGRFGEQSVLQRDDRDLATLAEAELRPLIGARAGSIDRLVTRWGGSLPQYRVGHVERVARIRSLLSRTPELAVAGAAYDGVGIAACIASGHAAAAQIADAVRSR